MQNLVFVERLDLIIWLEGASDESEYIKALESEVAASKSAQAALGGASGTASSAVPNGAAGGGRVGKMIDPRLQEIYNGERRMGDRNSILRGIKPTVSSALTFHPFPFEVTKFPAGLLPRPKIRRNLPRPQSSPPQ